MHICVGNLTVIGSDNGLSPGRRQAIILTNVGILSIRTLGRNFSEILSEIHSFSFKKKHLKMSFAKWPLSQWVKHFHSKYSCWMMLSYVQAYKTTFRGEPNMQLYYTGHWIGWLRRAFGNSNFVTWEILIHIIYTYVWLHSICFPKVFWLFH